MAIETAARATVATLCGAAAALLLAYMVRYWGLWDWHLVEWSQLVQGNPPEQLLVFLGSMVGFIFAFWLLLDGLVGDFLTAVSAVAAGACAAFVLQFALITFETGVDFAGLTLLVGGLGYTVYRTTLEQKDRKLKSLRERLGRPLTAVLFAFVAAFVVVMLFVPYAGRLSPSLAQLLPVFGENVSAHNIDVLADKTEKFLTALGALAALFAVSVVAQEVSPALKSVLSYIGLTPQQIDAARRLRHPIANAIRGKPLASQYGVQINITPTSSKRDLPHLTATDNKAIVRIVLPSDSKVGEPHMDFREFFSLWHEQATSAGVSLANSLVFVYMSAERTRGPICYGTALEFFELLEPATDHAQGRLQAQYSETFAEALRTRNRKDVIAIADAARAQILRYNPADDVLLSTTFVSEAEDVMTVMRTLAEKNLRRILVVTDRSPLEMAILSAPELSSFLLRGE